jgi:RNA polymerase sigma-70 factor (ECF subfamily)
LSAEDDERRLWFRREILPLEGRLLAYAARFARVAEAEDLVQETFARAIGCPTWRGVRNPAAFATGILRNLAIDDVRRRKVVPIESVADLERLGRPDMAPGPESAAIWRDDLRCLQALVEALPTQQRRVFTLRKVYGLSTREIAEKLGLSVSTVETHLAKGLQACSTALAGAETVENRRRSHGSPWTVRRRQKDGEP